MSDVLANGPVQRGQSPLRHIPQYEQWIFDIMTTDGTDELWQSPGINFEAYYEESADVPTVYSGAWYDSYTKATCDNFESLSGYKDSDHFLILGPWTHGWETYPLPAWQKTFSGELDFGTESTIDYQKMRLAFFDHYLKDRSTWNDQPTVRYWCMGTGDGRKIDSNRLFHGGEWNTANEWPLPETKFIKYYTQPDGTLSPDIPSVETDSTTYRFDPTNPVPTVGGNCSSYYRFKQYEDSLSEYPLEERKRVSITGHGGFNQYTRPDTLGASEPYGPLEQRDDVIVFRTPPLQEALKIVGPIRVRVYGSTDAPDTDFTAKLIDEYPPTNDFPNGFVANLSDSICRARYRGYRTEPDFVDTNKVYEFYMEPYPTSNVFKPGHSIRLDISSSNFPRYDVNRNTGESLYGGSDYTVARNTIYHCRNYPTHIELPIYPM